MKNSSRWDIRHYPKAFNTLSPDVRAKAIEVGNDLLGRGNAPEKVIPVAVEIAKDWINYSAPPEEKRIAPK